MRRFILTLFFTLAFVCTIQVQAEIVDKIIAKVGSDVITMSDVAKAIAEQRAYLIQTYGQQKGTEKFLKFKDNVLDEMILQKVLENEIKREGLQATTAEVDSEYQQRLNQFGISEMTLIGKLQNDGISLADFKKSIRSELEKQKLIQKKIMQNIAISDYDLQKEYEKNISKFQRFTKMSFVEAFLTVDKFASQEELASTAQKIQSMLKSGQNAAALIKQYSSGAYADQGGLSGLVAASQLRPEIQSVLSRMNKGETSEILPVQHGVFIFKLLDKADPEPVPFNEVANHLRGQFGQKVVQDELRKYLLSVKDQTYVEVLN